MPAPNDTFFWSGRLLLVGATGAETARLLESRQVVVGCAQKQADRLAGLQGQARSDLHRLIGIAGEHVQRRIVAQAFLHRCRRFRVGAEEAPRIAALRQQGRYGVAQLVHGCLMPCVQKKNGRRDKLILAQPFAIFLRGDEQAQQIIARCGAALSGVVADEGGEVARGLIGAALRLFVRAVHIHGDHAMRPFHELRPHIRGHAQHLRDDHQRNGRCIGSKQLRFAGLLKTVDQRVAERLDAGAQPLDLA